MNDVFAMIYRFARAAWRRRWWAVATAWAVALLGWSVVLVLPERYEASARMFVDARTPLRPVLEGIAIQEDYDSQLSLVREALLSRPQLEAVARQTNLDTQVKTPADRDTLIEDLQKQIQITSISPTTTTTPGQARNSLYTISYQHRDRAKSIEVVSTLLDNFREGTINGNRNGASQAQDFLKQQIAELEERLQEAEQRLADFKKRNIGLIPGERGDYFTRLNQEMNGLQEAQTNLAVAASRRTELQRQLASAQAYVPGTTASGTGAPGVTPDITQRRQEAEQHLEELLLKYTDRHPEVIALRKTIDELKQREAKELAELQHGGTGTGAIRSLSANPVYQQIQAQLNQVQVEIASYQGAAAQHEQEIANLRKYVDQAPEIEQEFARLNRDYSVTKAQYDQLVARREQARVSDDAARTGIVRFEVVEPPHAALRPVSPNRKVLFIAVLFAAIGAGLGLALLPQLIAPTFDDVASMERGLGLPVLGAVSVARSEHDLLVERRDVPRVLLAGGGLVVVTGVLVAIGSLAANALHRLV